MFKGRIQGTPEKSFQLHPTVSFISGLEAGCLVEDNLETELFRQGEVLFAH